MLLMLSLMSAMHLACCETSKWELKWCVFGLVQLGSRTCAQSLTVGMLALRLYRCCMLIAHVQSLEKLRSAPGKAALGHLHSSSAAKLPGLA